MNMKNISRNDLKKMAKAIIKSEELMVKAIESDAWETAEFKAAKDLHDTFCAWNGMKREEIPIAAIDDGTGRHIPDCVLVFKGRRI